MFTLPLNADYRYTYENLQIGGFAGTDLNMPTGGRVVVLLN